jgi:2-amino-4-hydroxy-6-hydroxymethyldihydropteridine diphosphokinase
VEVALTEENCDVYVALGSNQGDRALNLLKAWALLGKNKDITLKALSPPFLTSPVDMNSHHWFINAVGCLTTTLTPDSLLDVLLEIESVLGRARDSYLGGYQDRTIDLDLLYFGSSVQDSLRLTLPHPRRSERLFVLAPMAAIAPDFVDPELLQTLVEMHHQLLEKIKNNHIAQQEVTTSSWPKKY